MQRKGTGVVRERIPIVVVRWRFFVFFFQTRVLIRVPAFVFITKHCVARKGILPKLVILSPPFPLRNRVKKVGEGGGGFRSELSSLRVPHLQSISQSLFGELYLLLSAGSERNPHSPVGRGSSTTDRVRRVDSHFRVLKVRRDESVSLCALSLLLPRRAARKGLE